jgi:hypothetical protein
MLTWFFIFHQLPRTNWFRAEVEWMEANADNENFPEETSGSP